MLAQQTNNTNTPYGLQAEGMAFAIFPEHTTDEYKRTLLCITYRLIVNNPDVTVKTAYWILGRYFDNKAHIDWALKCLSTNIFKCVTRWLDENKVSHYKIKDHSGFNEWFQLQMDCNPQLKSFNVRKK